jgi:hypothetical protein
MADPKVIGEVEAEALLAIDVRGLSLDAMNLIGVLAEHGGASENDLHMLRYRWEFGLDPEAEVRQLRLPLSSNRRRLQANAARDALARAMELRDRTGWSSLSLP